MGKEKTGVAFRKNGYFFLVGERDGRATEKVKKVSQVVAIAATCTAEHVFFMSDKKSVFTFLR